MAELTQIAYPGPPVHGVGHVFDEVIDSNGVVWCCTTAGENKAGGTGRWTGGNAAQASGVFAANGGTSTAGSVAFSAPSVASGTPFTPSATVDTELSFIVTTAGTLTLTLGPTTGAEQAVITARTVPIGAFIKERIPAGYKVVVTLVTAVIADVLVQTC